MASTSGILSVGRAVGHIVLHRKIQKQQHDTFTHYSWTSDTLTNRIDVTTAGGAEEDFQGFRKPLLKFSA